MSPSAPDLILTNAHVLTLDPARPRASAVVVSGGRIAWVGESHRLSPATISAARLMDCGAQTVVPGFIDAHCHVLAYAASLIAVDCAPEAVSTIGDIIRAVRQRARRTPNCDWIRATGYSEFDLYEKRHPTRWDLDRAAPNNPVRLNHRSGHACVLNSAALSRVGICPDTDEPPGGTIARDLHTAEPNGLLLEMDAWLEDRIPPLGDAEIHDGVSQASERFLAQGVTSVQDATPSNSLKRWDALRRLKAQKTFTPTLSVMPAAAHMDEFVANNLRFGGGDEISGLAHAKIMLTRTGGSLFPSENDLSAIIAHAHGHGFPVAIHAVEADAVIAAAEAIEANHAPKLRDRIEHASECPPAALDALLNARPVVVSQPRFIHDSGSRYLNEFGADANWLYRFKTLTDAGIVLAAGSDAPVSRPNPIIAMHATVTRRAGSGEIIGRGERLTPMQALTMHTSAAAYAACMESEAGTIAPGKRADLAILTDDPTGASPETLLNIGVATTIVNGRIAWQA